MSYVRLKHTLAGIALDVTAHLDRAWIADALLAYTELSREGPEVSLAAVARAGGVPPAEARRALEATALFGVVADRKGTIALGAPFRAFRPYLDRQVARTVTAVRLLRADRPQTVPPEIWHVAALFNAGLFFECHEYLEDIWRATPDPERAFYHGLVQAAAGCYHFEKGNAHGARALLGKAVDKLEPYTPTHRSVQVATFLAGLRHVLSRLNGPPLGSGEIALPALDLAGAARARPRVRAASTPAPPEPPR